MVVGGRLVDVTVWSSSHGKKGHRITSRLDRRAASQVVGQNGILPGTALFQADAAGWRFLRRR